MKPQDRTRAIGRSKLPTGQKAVLWAIADRMGFNDTSFPGIPDICAFASLSPKQAKRHIKALDDLGVLSRKFRPGTLPPIYSIEWAALGSVVAAEHRRGGVRSRAKTAPLPTGAKTALQGKDCPSTRAKTAPRTGAKTALRSDQGSDQEATTYENAPEGADHQEADHETKRSPDVVPTQAGVGDGTRAGTETQQSHSARGAGVVRLDEGVGDREGARGADEAAGVDADRDGPNGLPPWIPSSRSLGAFSRREAYDGCIRLLTALKGKEPSERHLAAKRYGPGVKVFWLWEQLGSPPWDEFERDQKLIIGWAKSSADKEAASEIRAEDWSGGKDRSGDVGNLFRLSAPPSSSGACWHERLEKAQAWGGSSAEKPKHNGKPAPQMPKDVKDYRYLMTMTHPWGLPKEITDLWAHEDSTYTWEVPPYED